MRLARVCLDGTRLDGVAGLLLRVGDDVEPLRLVVTLRDDGDNAERPRLVPLLPDRRLAVVCTRELITLDRPLT